MLDYQAPQLAEGLAVSHPPSFCQTRDLRLIYADGLSRPLIWDGQQETPDQAGIIAPLAKPGFTASSGGAATEGVYFAGFRYYDSVHDVYSSLSPLAEVTAAEGDKFAYSGLVASTEDRVTHVEIWRSLAEEGDKFYRIARIANGTTTYSGDATSDDTLGTEWTVEEMLDLETADKQLWARRQGVPPNYMKVCVPFQDRTFWCALAIYDVGTATVGDTAEGATVSGYYLSAAMGTVSPEPLGFYPVAGTYNGLPYYKHQTENYYLWQDPDYADDHGLEATRIYWFTGSTLGTPGSGYHWSFDYAGGFPTVLGPVGWASGYIQVAAHTGGATSGYFTVTGSGTTWTTALEGRKIFLVGAPRSYTIQSVDEGTQVATIAESYDGPALSGVRYAIMADPKLWGNTLIYSEQDEPESVPATQNTIGVQESLPSDNDWVVGAVPHGTQLWVLKTRHVYSVTFARQPKIDAGISLRFDRGAFNHQCADYLVETLYLMDAMGPWAIGGGSAYIPLGPPIQDYFRNNRVDFGKRDWWFVSCSPSEKVVRFCITLEGQTGNRPKTALCYGTEVDKWWTETYQEGLSGSTRVEHLGKVRTVVGGSYERLLMLGEPQGDGVSCAGSVSSAGAATLVDSARSPFTADMVGFDVVIVHGTGAGQTRTISSVSALGTSGDSASKITVSVNWTTEPDETSTYTVTYPGDTVDGTAAGGTASKVYGTLGDFTSAMVGGTIEITAGTGDGQTRTISAIGVLIGFAQSYSTITVSAVFDTAPDSTSEYTITYPGTASGTAIEGGTNWLGDSAGSFVDAMVGGTVEITGGTGVGQTRTISAVDTYNLATETLDTYTTLTVDENWETAPDATSRYLINYAIRGTVTSATGNTLSDSTKTFPANLAGASVAIIAGTGIDQINYIVSVSGSQLTLRDNWTVTPTAGSTYLIGAIECTYRSGIMELPVEDKEGTERAVELVYEPSDGQQHVDWRLLWDHLLTGDESWLDFTKAGLAATQGSVNKRLDLNSSRSALASSPGIERIPFRARASNKIISHRFLSSELHWFQADRGVQLYSLENE